MTDVSDSLGGLPSLQFSFDRQRQLETTSDGLVHKALEAYDQFHAHKKLAATSKQWRLVKRRKSLTVYRERGQATSRQSSRVYLCSGVIPGTVEDMVHGSYFDDTESMRIGVSVLMDKCLDARVLHVFERNAAACRVVFSGIKWLALKTPTSAALINDRDLLFYNRIGRIVDRRGRYFVYCVMDSIDLDQVPVYRQHRLERSSVSLCYLFRQVHEEWVGCFVMGTSSMGGSLPRSVSELITAERMLSIGNLMLVARAKAYSARMATSADRLPSTSLSCDVCMKKASLLRGTVKLCMGCRRNTCRRCREWCTVFRLEYRTQKPCKERFCMPCISDVTRVTVSSFYISSLNEFTSTSIDLQSSIESSVKYDHSSHSSSPREISDCDLDQWFPATQEPPLHHLEGLATFVERASVASAKDMQWNRNELQYFSNLLRESGHFQPNESTSSSTAATRHDSPTRATQSQSFDPTNSMPLPRPVKIDGTNRAYMSEDFTLLHLQALSVDELD
ncbi:hypothetical protein CCR75_008125 [Bremia lactucae]|uniref:FYVE-type domain-containing protein n=1 Tax=Bremia lactucae TaxID=4779 RepID=A0A976FNJ4_BRELC|nr:hypothetical protein CCR75_008125 [Bremia lactucae]